MRFRGREISHHEIGMAVLTRLREQFEAFSQEVEGLADEYERDVSEAISDLTEDCENEFNNRIEDAVNDVEGEAAETLMDEVNETKSLFETGERIVQELEPLVQDVVIAGNVAIALDQSVQEMMA